MRESVNDSLLKHLLKYAGVPCKVDTKSDASGLLYVSVEWTSQGMGSGLVVVSVKKIVLLEGCMNWFQKAFE